MNPRAAHTLRDPIEAFVARRHAHRAAPPVPLRGLELLVTIRGGLAVVEATRTYVNDEADPIEALLTLPVPVHAAFFGLSARIGGVLHHGQAQSKVAARARYEEGLRQGKAAVLHEELLRGVHSLSLANLGPGESAEVTMRWAEALRCNGPVGRLRIPMTVGHVYGCSGLEDADELVGGGKPLAAGLKVVHDARAVSVEAPGRGGGPDGPGGADGAAGSDGAGGAGGDVPADAPDSNEPATSAPAPDASKTPDEEAGLATTVSTDAPVDLRVDGWRQGGVTGRRWDGKRVTLTIEPAGEGDAPLDVAVLLDRSGSMHSPCEGHERVRPASSPSRIDSRTSKHSAAVEAIADLAARLRPADRMALWQFDTVCEPVGPERPGPVADVPRLVRRFGEPRGGTEIGHSIQLCAARAGVRDILLVTDGLSHAMDPHALARRSGRVFVVLVGEDSLEANVGHLAALSGGDLRFSVGADMRPAIAGVLAGLRSSAESRTPGNVRILTTESGEAEPEGAAVERSAAEAAVGAYAAHLALADMDEEEAGDLAAREGLVTHLTSLSIVDEQGTRQEGLPVTRKVRMAMPRTVGSAARQGILASSSLGEADMWSARFAKLDNMSLACRVSAPQRPRDLLTRMARRLLSRPAGIAQQSPTGPPGDAEIVLVQLADELRIRDRSGFLDSLTDKVDWQHGRALAKADLTGLPGDVARQVVELSNDKKVKEIADTTGLEPIATAIAVLALLARRQSRLAARVFHAIAAQLERLLESS